MSPSENKTVAAESLDSPAVDLAALADVIALIATDAGQSSAEYLEETVVPHGGE